MDTLDFEAELKKAYNQLEEPKTAALATSSNNKPTVRNMSIIFYDKKIYFQTGIDLIKYEQICENKNVALCFGNVQIDGTANIIGKPMEHEKIMEVFKKYHKISYETYSKLDKEILIEINIQKITKWEYDKNGKSYRIFIELESGKAYKVYYI